MSSRQERRSVVLDRTWCDADVEQKTRAEETDGEASSEGIILAEMRTGCSPLNEGAATNSHHCARGGIRAVHQQETTAQDARNMT